MQEKMALLIRNKPQAKLQDHYKEHTMSRKVKGIAKILNIVCVCIYIGRRQNICKRHEQT